MSSKLNFQGKNYPKLFDQSYSYTSNLVKLQDRHCGKASLYEVTLGWLKIIQEAACNESESNKILLTKLSFMVPHLEQMVHWAHECNGISFVRDLILLGPKFYDAPERKAKIPLGEAGLLLMAELLVNRVNTLADRASKRMCYNKDNESCYYESVEQLAKTTPGYFEWKGSSSDTHLTFALAVVHWWRTLDERVIQSVKEVIEETKKNALIKKEQKQQDKLDRVKKNDQEELEKLQGKKKEEQGVVKMYAPITPTNQNVWKKPEVTVPQEPKKEKLKKEQPKKLQSKQNNQKRDVKKEESLEQQQEQEQQNQQNNGGKWNIQKKKTFRGKHNFRENEQDAKKQRPKAQFVLRGPKKVQQQNA